MTHSTQDHYLRGFQEGEESARQGVVIGLCFAAVVGAMVALFVVWCWGWV